MSLTDSPPHDDPPGTSPLKAALLAALHGDPYEVGRQREVLELFIRGLAPLLRDDAFQNYIRECNDLFQRAKELDWGRILAGWDHLQVLEMLSCSRPGVVYCMPFIDGTYFPLVPGATLEDNRLAILLGFPVLFPDDPLDSVAYFAVVIRGREAATLELQRRFGRLAPWADRLLGVLELTEPWASNELRRLLSEVTPRDSWILGRGFSLFGDGGAKPDEQWKKDCEDEVASRTGYHLSTLLGDLEKKPLKDLVVDMLDGRFEFLDRDMKNKVVDDLRKEHSRRGRPRQDKKSKWGDSLKRLSDVVSDVAPPSDAVKVRPDVLDRLAEWNQEKLEGRLGETREELVAAGCGKRVAEILLRFIRTQGVPSSRNLAEELGVSERQIRYDLGMIRKKGNVILRIIFGDG